MSCTSLIRCSVTEAVGSASFIRKFLKCRHERSLKLPLKCKPKAIKVRPEIMIPLVGFPRELKLQIDIVRRVAGEVAKEKETKFNYLVGTMIEIPRAALVADQIARDAEFFSFGTNDLTQTTLGNEPGRFRKLSSRLR